MQDQIEHAKFYIINTLLISFSFTGAETILKVLSLIIAISYTLRRWYLTEKKYKDENK